MATYDFESTLTEVTNETAAWWFRKDNNGSNERDGGLMISKDNNGSNERDGGLTISKGQ